MSNKNYQTTAILVLVAVVGTQTNQTDKTPKHERKGKKCTPTVSHLAAPVRFKERVE
eukprot:m.311544 g.311544  ORF g.311544 m.311544 type:complete len:57 (+) comp15957_c0_seq1:22-192(+)